MGYRLFIRGNPLSDAVKPKNKIWRKRNEGLVMTTKGSKDLAGGKRLHLIVVISYGRGVILAEPYEKMSADFFAEFIRRHFPNLFEIAEKGESDQKIFVMDNDPSQTSSKAMETLMNMGYTLQRIPPRSPDLNPIENVFHLVRKRFEAQVKDILNSIKLSKIQTIIDKIHWNDLSLETEFEMKPHMFTYLSLFFLIQPPPSPPNNVDVSFKIYVFDELRHDVHNNIVWGRGRGGDGGD